MDSFELWLQEKISNIVFNGVNDESSEDFDAGAYWALKTVREEYREFKKLNP